MRDYKDLSHIRWDCKYHIEQMIPMIPGQALHNA